MPDRVVGGSEDPDAACANGKHGAFAEQGLGTGGQAHSRGASSDPDQMAGSRCRLPGQLLPTSSQPIGDHQKVCLDHSIVVERG